MLKNCYHTSQIFWDMPVRYRITICPRERSEGDLCLDLIVLLFSIFLIGNWWVRGPFFHLILGAFRFNLLLYILFHNLGFKNLVVSFYNNNNNVYSQ